MRARHRRLRLAPLAWIGWVAAACGGAPEAMEEEAAEAPEAAPTSAVRELGPVDGRELPGTDFARVALGDPAPDFSLATYRGDTLTLSENRGAREILLVFYRGAW